MVTIRGIVFSARDLVIFLLFHIFLLPIHRARADEKVIGFASRWFHGNIKYLYREMENYNDVKVYFVTDKKKELERLESSGVNAFYCRNIAKMPLFLRTAIWVTGGGMGDERIPFMRAHRILTDKWLRKDTLLKKCLGVQIGKRVDVWHSIRGTSDEILGRAKEVERCDIGFVTSELLKQRILSFSGADISDKLKVAGFPRTDPLIKKNLDREKILKSYGLPLNRKNILYAPTCARPYSAKKPFFPWGRIDKIIKDVDRFCERNNCNFLIRMHPYWEKEEVEQKEKVDENIKLSKKIFNVPYMKYLDTELILYITDVLITDFSTIANDFILLKRPLIHLVPIRAHSHAQHTVGYRVRSETEFFEKLQESLDSPKLFEKEREKYLREIYDDLDGNSSKRCAEVVMKLLENPS